MPRSLYLRSSRSASLIEGAECGWNVPSEKVESLADQQESLRARKEGLACARNVLVGRVLGQNGKGRVDLAQVILHADEVE